MKRGLILTLGVLALVAGPIEAQRTETLVSSRHRNGGFGGPVMKVGGVLGDPALFLGGRGGWVVGRTFVLGGGGYGLVNDNIPLRVSYQGRDPVLEMGYGGLEMEYLHTSYRLAHFSVQTLLGGGGVRYRDRQRFETLAEDNFFVVEPGAHANLNITEYLRLSGGFNYRWTWGAELPGLRDQDLSGPLGVFTIRFGRY